MCLRQIADGVMARQGMHEHVFNSRFAELNTSAWWAAGLWWSFTSFKKVKMRGGSLVGGEKNHTLLFWPVLGEPKQETTHVPSVTHSYHLFFCPNPKRLLQIILQMWMQPRLSAARPRLSLHTVLGPLLVTVVCRTTTVLANSTVREVVSSCSTSVTCLIVCISIQLRAGAVLPAPIGAASLNETPYTLA